MTAKLRTRLERVLNIARPDVLAPLLVAASLSASGGLKAEESTRPIRIGMIGLDTTHVIGFTHILNDPRAAGDLAGAKVVAGYPGGSKDFPASRDRVKGFTEQLRGMGVEIVDSIEQLLPKVDAVMLESVDGRPHLKQAAEVFRSGKPIFIDKPVAASFADVLEIYRLAKMYKVPCFSASMLRFTPAVQEIQRGKATVGKVRGCDVYGPCSTAIYHPSLYFYGIHGIEMLSTIMGRGCVSVAAVQTPSAEEVIGVWADGRVGAYRGIRSGAATFGATVFGTKGIVSIVSGGEDRAMAAQLIKFFKTGKPPVTAEETIDIYAIMEAADDSKRQEGKMVSIAETLEKAEKKRQ